MDAKVVMLMRKSPYGSVYPAEGYRAMMGMGVFEMNIRVIFMDDGVYALVKGQEPGGIDMQPLGNAFLGLADVGVKEFFAHDEALAERGLTAKDLVMDVRVATGIEIDGILKDATAILPF